MTNIAISSSQDAALNQDVTLSVANASSSDYYFDEVEVYEKTNARAIGDWRNMPTPLLIKRPTAT